jgi:hypothetical protein
LITAKHRTIEWDIRISEIIRVEEKVENVDDSAGLVHGDESGRRGGEAVGVWFAVRRDEPLLIRSILVEDVVLASQERIRRVFGELGECDGGGGRGLVDGRECVLEVDGNVRWPVLLARRQVRVRGVLEGIVRERGGGAREERDGGEDLRDEGEHANGGERHREHGSDF